MGNSVTIKPFSQQDNLYIVFDWVMELDYIVLCVLAFDILTVLLLSRAVVVCKEQFCPHSFEGGQFQPFFLA